MLFNGTNHKCLTETSNYTIPKLIVQIFGFEGGMWDLIVLIPDHYPFFYFSDTSTVINCYTTL